MRTLLNNCVTCAVFTLALSLIVTSVLLLIFSIIALSHTSLDETREKCSKSNIWIYLLITVIVSGTSAIVSSNETEKNKKNIFLSMVFSLGLIIWGNIELFIIANNCDALHSTGVYKMTYITVILYDIGIGIVTFCGFIWCYEIGCNGVNDVLYNDGVLHAEITNQVVSKV